MPGKRNLYKRENVMKFKVCGLLFILSMLLLAPAQGSSKRSPSIKAGLAKAIKYFERGDYAGSKHVLSILVRYYPRKALLWFNMGNADFMLENFQEAIISYENVISLNSSLSLPSQLYITKSYRRLGKCEEAASIMKKLKGKEMLPAIRSEFRSEMGLTQKCLLKKGLHLYRNGEFSESIEYFDTVLSLSDSEKAHMMKGLALLRSGDSSGARSSFEKIMQHSGKSSDDEFKSFARHFVKEIDDGKWMLVHNYMLRSLLGAGFNSNPYRTGVDLDTSGKGTFFINMDAAYKFVRKRSFSAFVYYSLLYEEIFGLPELRYFENILSVPLIYFDAPMHIKVSPNINYSILDDTSFLFRAGSDVLLQYGETYKLGAAYSYLRNVSFNDTYEYLEGNYHDFLLFGAYENDHLILRPGFKVIADDIGDLSDLSTLLPLANISYGPSLLINWMFKENWLLKINNLFLIRDYDNVSIPGSIEREDKQWQGNIRISTQLKNNLSPFISLAGVVNRSSLGISSVEDKNYYQMIVLLGVSWDILK